MRIISIVFTILLVFIEQNSFAKKDIIFGELLPPLNERKILGTWEAPYLGRTWSFESCHSKMYRVTRCSDGSGGNDGEQIIKIGNDKYKEVDNNYGEYWKILSGGDLSCYDSQGYIFTLKKSTSLWPKNSKTNRPEVRNRFLLNHAVNG